MCFSLLDVSDPVWSYCGSREAAELGSVRRTENEDLALSAFDDKSKKPGASDLKPSRSPGGLLEVES